MRVMRILAIVEASVCLCAFVCLSIYGCMKTMQESRNLHYRLPQIRF